MRSDSKVVQKVSKGAISKKEKPKVEKIAKRKLSAQKKQ
jgi:hypothetical protein